MRASTEQEGPPAEHSDPVLMAHPGSMTSSNLLQPRLVSPLYQQPRRAP
jgi:hypothetical protein